MVEQSSQFIGSIPQNYDEGLGPHIFESYAHDLAGRAASSSPDAVLELAAGTGIVTRALRAALPARCRLIATDLNPPMLAVAREKFSDPDANVEFRQLDAMDIVYPESSFDVVVCQFGVMFFPDKVRS